MEKEIVQMGFRASSLSTDYEGLSEGTLDFILKDPPMTNVAYHGELFGKLTVSTLLLSIEDGKLVVSVAEKKE